jgi:hypothetical protein
LKNENYELCFLVSSFVNQITTGKKGTVLWPLVGMFGGSISLDCFGGFLDQITTRKKGTVVWPSVAMSDCFGGFVTMFFGGFLNQITNYDGKKIGTVIWLAYTICNTRNILFLLCLYLKQGNKLNVGIIWFEGKAPTRTSKTCLTMVEPFACPSSMAMGNHEKIRTVHTFK